MKQTCGKIISLSKQDWTLMQSVKSIPLNEGVQDLLSSVLRDHSRLLQLLLFGHPSLNLNPQLIANV